jgi:hypothetical protein
MWALRRRSASMSQRASGCERLRACSRAGSMDLDFIPDRGCWLHHPLTCSAHLGLQAQVAAWANRMRFENEVSLKPHFAPNPLPRVRGRGRGSDLLSCFVKKVNINRFNVKRCQYINRSGRRSRRMVVAISSIDLWVDDSQAMPSRRIMASACLTSSWQFSIDA